MDVLQMDARQILKGGRELKFWLDFRGWLATIANQMLFDPER